MMICALPERIRSAAIAIACSPEEQKRLMVTPGTASGSPERSAAIRAMFIPDSPSGLAQPSITSSTSSATTAGCFSSSRRITVAAKSSGRVVRSAPLGAFPIAVRRQSTITASFMFLVSRLLVFSLVSERLSCLQHIPHSFLRFRIAAQAQKCFALQVQQVLLGNQLLTRQPPAGKNIRQFLCDHYVVIADVVTLPRHPRAQLQHRESALARHLDVRARNTRRVSRRERKRQGFGIANQLLRVHRNRIVAIEEAKL